jgi:hypothetical protein
MRVVAWTVGCLALMAVAHVQAQNVAAPRRSPHPWQSAQPRGEAEAYFTNVQSGDRIETPFLLKFGLSGGWGLAPIAKPLGGKSGHHHLLVNRDLPLDFKAALPFNDQYIHFGKGQMETVLTLAPGTYTLRMLLADDKHLPHFVYSKPLRLVVTKKNDTDPKSLIKKGIEIHVGDGVAKVPFRVQFHASGLNVAHVVQQEKDTGHFKLTVTSKAGPVAEMDFVDGQTETWLSPPPGDYSLKLEMLDNLSPNQPMVNAVTTSVRVQPYALGLAP